MVGLLAAVENILPPLPADTGVALGAFLSYRGVTTPLGVFLVVWVSNVLGATGVYLASRRYGRRLFATGVGRKLLTPRALAVIEREYVRFGPVGIFFTRLLPGVRAVVPPFAGLAGLPLGRAMAPIALASALWYGGLTLLGVALGSQWDRLVHAITSLDRVLGFVAAAAVLAGIGWYLVRKRRADRRPDASALSPPLATALTAALRRERGGGASDDPDQPLRAAAILLLELAYADEHVAAADRGRIADDLRQRWGLTAAAPAGDSGIHHTRLEQIGAMIRGRFDQEERCALVERLWTVALSIPAPREGADRLLALAADLLGLGPDELARARATAGEESSGNE